MRVKIIDVWKELEPKKLRRSQRAPKLGWHLILEHIIMVISLQNPPTKTFRSNNNFRVKDLMVVVTNPMLVLALVILVKAVVVVNPFYKK